MDNATLRGELEYWIGEAVFWPCRCQRISSPVHHAPIFLCDSCRIQTSLEAAAAHADQDDWPAAHRAILSAARIDGRLDSLRDAIGVLAFPEEAAPYEELDVTSMGTGPMRAPGPREKRQPREREQDPNAMYSCGLTHAEHREICADVIRREAEMEKVGQFWDEFRGVQWQMGTHNGCGSTFSWPLPDRRDWTPPEVERANRRARVEELARAMEERLADDPRRLIVREWLGLRPGE
jgi:hypothetical protein